MTAPIILGSGVAEFTGKSRSWTPEGGVTSNSNYDGTAAKIAELFNSLKNVSGITSMTERVENNGRKASLVVVRADDAEEGSQNTENDNSEWELVANEVLKDLRQHPYFNALSSVVINLIERDIGEGIVTANLSADGQKYYDMRIKGIDSFPISQPVIRKSLEFAKDNNNIKTDSLLADRVVPLTGQGAGAINPPDRILAAVQTLTYVDSSGNPQSGSFEWLKKFPTIRISNNRRLSLSYEWWGARKWSAILHGGTATP